jgi:hypothetical protein
MKFRNQRDYFRTNYKTQENKALAKEREVMWKRIESIPNDKNVWPDDIAEIYNCKKEI